MKKIYPRIFILILLSLLVNINSHAQKYTFKVLTFSGAVDYRKSSNQSWNTVQSGEGLKKDYEIRLGKNSYAALMYNDGRTVEIQDEGIFEVRVLEQNIRNSKISVIKKFTNFVVEEIITYKSEKKDMKTFAAVVRVKPNHIDTAIPTKTSTLDPTLNLVWYSYPSSQKYILSILNTDNISIFMDLVEDTSFTLDTEKLNLTRGKLYKWVVFDAENPAVISDTNSIFVVSEAERIAISDTLQLINSELETNETALAFFSLGMFYEKSGLNIEAMNQYKKAILMVPESEEFKKLYAKFLVKQKLYILVSELFEYKQIN